jgi:teichuronic acid biosynthesis glycosyltransferase TuaC
MKVLTLTNMYPTENNPQFGIFVREQVESLRACGVEIDVLFVNGREGRLRHKGYLTAVPRLWAQLMNHRYDLIHAHYVFSGMIARAQFRLPLVLTHHGPELRDPFQGKLCRATRGWADELIVVADWMVSVLDPRRECSDIHVIPCGVDLSLFRPMSQAECRTRLGLKQDARYVLFAGNTWDERKRYRLVEAAVEKLRSANPDIELLTVCGQSHDVIPLYMNAADVFAMTSVLEGSAQVVKEAMACNLPVVATDAGDNWNVIGSTDGCFKADDSVDKIAANLLLAMSPPRRTTGRQAVNRFGIDAIARSVLDVYEGALDRAARSVAQVDSVRRPDLAAE